MTSAVLAAGRRDGLRVARIGTAVGLASAVVLGALIGRGRPLGSSVLQGVAFAAAYGAPFLGALLAARLHDDRRRSLVLFACALLAVAQSIAILDPGIVRIPAAVLLLVGSFSSWADRGPGTVRVATVATVALLIAVLAWLPILRGSPDERCWQRVQTSAGSSVWIRSSSAGGAVIAPGTGVAETVCRDAISGGALALSLAAWGSGLVALLAVLAADRRERLEARP